jgi:hypothetical protein
MLDTFAYLRQYHVDPEVLNRILAAERDRNKGILEYLHARFRARLEENTSVIFEKGNDETGRRRLRCSRRRVEQRGVSNYLVPCGRRFSIHGANSARDVAERTRGPKLFRISKES